MKKNKALFTTISLISSILLGWVAQAQKPVSAPIKVTNDPLMWELPMKETIGTGTFKYKNQKTGKVMTVVISEKSGKISEREDAYKKRLPRMKLWSAKVFEIIRDETTLAQMKTPIPTDMNYFCPKYKSLNETQRMTFWGQLVAALTFRESGWKPTMTYLEPDHKIDAVTKKFVRSEGLMQLSYQDVSSYRDLDCGFEWKKDKDLAPNDPHKSILAPFRNLRCGILILDKKVRMNHEISTPNTYWSVLRPTFNPKYKLDDPRRGNKNSKISWIAEQTKSLSFCK
ncbi:MAG: hypothetical protein H7Z71_03655 [Moraxellaceae bacterium]|nr:hypothetical protein [Pseudobdellovibrionaceae bacterium]